METRTVATRVEETALTERVDCLTACLNIVLELRSDEVQTLLVVSSSQCVTQELWRRVDEND